METVAILLNAVENKQNLPPEAWSLITLVVAAIIRYFEKRSDKRKAKKAIQRAVDKTKDGILVIPEKELEDSEKPII